MLSREFVQRIMKSAAQAQEASPTFEGLPVHELKNIVVEEVSLVDYAANRRSFLVKKRDQDAAAAAAAADGAAPVVVDADDVIDLTQTAKGETPGADLDRQDAAKAKVEREAADAAAVQREKDIVAKGTAEPDEKPAEEKPVAEEEKPVEEAAAADPEEDPTVVEPAATTDKGADPPVKKVGRPMQGKRLARLRQAYKTLGEIMAELGDEEAEKASEDDGAAAAAAAAAAPVVVVDTSKSDEQIALLNRKLDTLQKIVNEQAARLGKSQIPADSNAISLEKNENGHDRVSWSRDMAAPTERIKGRTF